MIDILVEAAGWTGMILLLLSYFLLSTRRLEPQGLTYQGMNILGALALAINTFYHGAIPSSLLNIVWMLIGLGATANILRKAKAPRP